MQYDVPGNLRVLVGVHGQIGGAAAASADPKNRLGARGLNRCDQAIGRLEAITLGFLRIGAHIGENRIRIGAGRIADAYQVDASGLIQRRAIDVGGRLYAA